MARRVSRSQATRASSPAVVRGAGARQHAHPTAMPAKSVSAHTTPKMTRGSKPPWSSGMAETTNSPMPTCGSTQLEPKWHTGKEVTSTTLMHCQLHKIVFSLQIFLHNFGVAKTNKTTEWHCMTCSMIPSRGRVTWPLSQPLEISHAADFCCPGCDWLQGSAAIASWKHPSAPRRKTSLVSVPNQSIRPKVPQPQLFKWQEISPASCNNHLQVCRCAWSTSSFKLSPTQLSTVVCLKCWAVVHW